MQLEAFSKGLSHSQSGEVDPGQYESLLHALETGQPSDFEAIQRGSGRRFANPQAAFASHIEGGYPRQFGCPPAPPFASRAAANELTELYWQALCRDIPFAEYPTSPLVAQAAAALGASAANILRGPTSADLYGPYVSQFLWKPIPRHSGRLEQLYRAPTPGSDFMTTFGEWLQIQDGVSPWRLAGYEQAPRYIRNGRDLAEYVHYDYGYEPFLNAALILLNRGPETVLYDNPFFSPLNAYKHSKVQEGWVTFGAMEVVDWVGRVTTAALKAAWFQKWLVHLRIRPEEFGGRLHQVKTGNVPLAPVTEGPRPSRSRQSARSRNPIDGYPIHPLLLESEAVEEVFRRTGSYLLPQAYPEGCPLHPSYPSGHATVAGACSVILKALFDEAALIPDCVEASPDGLSLLRCPSSFAPTVGAEVNKLAYNVAMGRNWAGIHYRSDIDAGLRLGEDVGIAVLQDLVQLCTEDFEGYAFTRFDGTYVRISQNGEVV